MYVFIYCNNSERDNFLNICSHKTLPNCLKFHNYPINNVQYLYTSILYIPIVTLPDDVFKFFCDSVGPQWRCKLYNKVKYKRFCPASEHVGPPGCPVVRLIIYIPLNVLRQDHARYICLGIVANERGKAQ